MNLRLIPLIAGENVGLIRIVTSEHLNQIGPNVHCFKHAPNWKQLHAKIVLRHQSIVPSVTSQVYVL